MRRGNSCSGYQEMEPPDIEMGKFYEFLMCCLMMVKMANGVMAECGFMFQCILMRGFQILSLQINVTVSKHKVSKKKRSKKPDGPGQIVHSEKASEINEEQTAEVLCISPLSGLSKLSKTSYSEKSAIALDIDCSSNINDVIDISAIAKNFSSEIRFQTVTKEKKKIGGKRKSNKISASGNSAEESC